MSAFLRMSLGLFRLAHQPSANGYHRAARREQDWYAWEPVPDWSTVETPDDDLERVRFICPRCAIYGHNEPLMINARRLGLV
jgi:hypothetical protein